MEEIPCQRNISLPKSPRTGCGCGFFCLCPSFSTFYLFSFSFYTNLFHRNQPTLKLMKLQWNETKFLEINRLKLPGGKYFINCSAKLPIIHTNGFRWICFFLQVLCKKNYRRKYTKIYITKERERQYITKNKDKKYLQKFERTPSTIITRNKH